MQKQANNDFALAGGEDNSQRPSASQEEQHMNTLPRIDASSMNHAERYCEKPNHNDVVLGRGRGNKSHPGNRYFNQLILEHMSQYNETTSKDIKSQVVSNIMGKIQDRDGRFVKHDKKCCKWVFMSDGDVKFRVTQALRYQIRKCATKSGHASSCTTQQQFGRTTPLQLRSRTILDNQAMLEKSEKMLSEMSILETIGYVFEYSSEDNAPRLPVAYRKDPGESPILGAKHKPNDDMESLPHRE
jgi:hypothetical protein